MACAHHAFAPSDTSALASALLQWYDANQREMPWRHSTKSGSAHAPPAAHGADDDTKGYAIWVSEVMCQQTQVATVIPYYEKWMAKWPTLQALAQAELAEVHAVWAGLGYYSRATRLLEGAQQVVSKHQGRMPRTAEQLKALPGIGPYTAAAIASIAYGERKGVVDGNVSRVLSRLRIISAEISSDAVVKHLAKLADSWIDPRRPGDFNQAVMELGATVCTPKSPSCAQCPLQSHCLAFQQAAGMPAAPTDAATAPAGAATPPAGAATPPCKLCAAGGPQSLDGYPAVTIYPRKKKKQAVPEQAVPILVCSKPSRGQRHLLLQKRPKAGLMANLWTFPMAEQDSELSSGEQGGALSQAVERTLQVPQLASMIESRLRLAGTVTHVFSHLKHIYHVFVLDLTEEEPWTLCLPSGGSCWAPEDKLMEQLVSTNMRKVFEVSRASLSSSSDGKKKTAKRAASQPGSDESRAKAKKTTKRSEKTQPGLESFGVVSTKKK